MACRGFTVAAALGILVAIMTCFLGAASGLKITHNTEYARTHNGPPPAKRFGYTPGSVIIIDLGNTNSCVAGYDPGKPKTTFQFCIPSCVAFTGDGATLVGEAAKKHVDADPSNAISGFKRLLGLQRNHEYEEAIVQRSAACVSYKIGTRNVVHPCVELNKDKHQQLEFFDVASMHFGVAATWEAVLAAELAGLDVDVDGDTVPEPVAAAVAHGLHRKLREDGGALVLRVSGGSADTSIVVLWDGALEIVGYQDDPFLGGDDFDQRVVDHFVELIHTKHGKDVSRDRIALGKLRTACERAKKGLSSQERVQPNGALKPPLIDIMARDCDYNEYVSMYKSPPDKLFGYTPGRAIVLDLDLGNTNSCVAGYSPGKPKTMF
ncbi:hypothetical protein PR202_ga03984 [Eleusine coracana subsp. coracana]|uniref:Uncharacterized protein n=1 Tax=Eleusine coracana subsp. coracana TaxID=191504 RepID=A0AAV5BR68_ELECO|nr:hypothetical protein PR202_ga03984 [Eleusine coracana subsp. coracana]